MRTITVTKARANLGHWVRRALRGEEIGVVLGSQMVALRPVTIEAGDYMEREYGLTKAEADQAAAAFLRDHERDKAAGEYINLDDLLDQHASSGQSHSKSRRANRRTARR